MANYQSHGAFVRQRKSLGGQQPAVGHLLADITGGLAYRHGSSTGIVDGYLAIDSG